MKANELRIGNLIHHNNDGINEVVEIKSIGYKAEGYSGYYLTYKGGSSTLESLFGDDYLNTPIPLTEEWLVKFGYKYKSYGYGEEEWKQWSFKGYSLNGFTCNTSGVNIKYVHQLQNLYFALTGEELTIKQPQ